MYRPRAKLGPQKIVGNGEVATHRASQPSTAQPTSTGTAAREPASQRNKWPRAAPFGESEISIVEIGVITPRGAWVGRVSTAKKKSDIKPFVVVILRTSGAGLGRAAQLVPLRRDGRQPRPLAPLPGPEGSSGSGSARRPRSRAAVCRGRRSRTGFESAP